MADDDLLAQVLRWPGLQLGDRRIARLNHPTDDRGVIVLLEEWDGARWHPSGTAYEPEVATAWLAAVARHWTSGPGRRRAPAANLYS